MPFNDIEIQRIDDDMADFMRVRQPAKHVRDKVDLKYRVYGFVIEIFETHFVLVEGVVKTQEIPVAKLQFSRNNHEWDVYWMHTDLEWHKYNEWPIKEFREALTTIAVDRYGCFFG